MPKFKALELRQCSHNSLIMPWNGPGHLLNHRIFRNLTMYEIECKKYSKEVTMVGLFPLGHTEFTSDGSLATSSLVLFLTFFSHDPLGSLHSTFPPPPTSHPWPCPVSSLVLLIFDLCLSSILAEEGQKFLYCGSLKATLIPSDPSVKILCVQNKTFSCSHCPCFQPPSNYLILFNFSEKAKCWVS